MGKEEAKKEAKKEAKAEKKEAKAEKKEAKNIIVTNADTSPLVYDKIPFYPFTYVAKDSNGNVLGKYYVQFKIRIIKHKFIEYVVELFPLYSTNVITEFSFTVKRTKDNIEKNAKRLFNLDKSGYPGRDGQTFNNEVSKVILGLFNNPSSQKATATATATSVEIEPSAIEAGDSFGSGNADYTILTLPTTTANGTCYLYNMDTGLKTFSMPSTVIYQTLTYTVVSIGTPGSIPNCFAGVTGLTSVSIPTSVTYIGISAFYNCSNLTTLIIPSGSLLQNIDANAFQGTILSYVGVNNNGYNSFTNCSGLTNIGAYAFYNTYIQNIIINSTATNGCIIGDSAFYNCNYIGQGTAKANMNLNLGGVVSIGQGAFQMAENKSNVFTCVTLDQSTTSIGISAFYNCTNITSLVIPSGSKLQSIGNYVFSNNIAGVYSQLKYIGTGIVNGVTSWNSFANCTALSNIGVNAFYNSNIQTLIINSTAKNSSDTFVGCTIASSAFYNCIEITGNVQLTGVVSIGQGAFQMDDNNNFNSVTLGTSTNYIGVSAFYNCSNLTTLIIPENSQLQNIDANAFRGTILSYVGVNNNGYNSFTNCSGLTNIGASAFYNTYIQNIIINSTATNGCTIGDSAFYNCNYIGKGTLATNMNLNLGGVVSIGEGAFQMASSTSNVFTCVTLDSNTISISDSAFYNCTNITSLVIPSGSKLQSIGNYVFSNNIAGVYSQLKYIGTGLNNWNSFANCTALNYIGVNAFYNTFMTNLAFNTSSTLTIGASAFYDCSNITSINFVTNYNNNMVINTNAFGLCTGLQSVAIGNYGIGINSSTPPVSNSWNTVFPSLTNLQTVYYNSYTVSPSNANLINNSSYLTTIFFNSTNFDSTNTTNIIVGTNCPKLTNVIFQNDVYTINGSTGAKTSQPINITGQINQNASILYYNASTIGANNGNTPLISNCPIGLVLTTNGLINSGNFTNQFQSNTNLQWVQVTGSNNNMTISTNMFSSCSGLNYIGTGQGINAGAATNWFTTPGLSFQITGIGQSAFYNCTSIPQLNINSSLNVINNSAFQGCTSLTYVNLPSTTGQGFIGTSAFYGCSLLSLVNIPYILGSYNVSSNLFTPCVQDGVFYGCAFTNINFENTTPPTPASGTSVFVQGIQTIGVNSFASNSSLTSINLVNDNTANSIISIGQTAFGNCTALNNVTMLPTATAAYPSIASDAFSGCSALQNPSVKGIVNTSLGTNTVTNYFTTGNGYYVNFVSYP